MANKLPTMIPSALPDVFDLTARGKRQAALDDAHIGDIEGAWGTIHRQDHTPRKTFGARLLTILIIAGPGLITMVGDNDAGGIATYTQAGQNYGVSLLWTLLLLIPVLIVNQEMVVRLGAVTGVGHARLIFERFGKFWGAFSLGDLFLLNFLTIISEFIGFSLALQYFGVSPLVSVPLGIVGLIAITVTGSYRIWERAMWICIGVSLLMIPLAFFTHPSAGPILRGTLLPGVRGGLTSTALLVLIAIVGTTVAPWQLFFQQSNVIDKRITPRWIGHERIDTIVGAFVTNITAAGLMVAAAFAFAHTPYDGRFVNIGATATALAHAVSPALGAMLALILLNASIIGACAVTLSTSYAFGDVFQAKHSLHRGVFDAKLFYGSFVAMIAAAGAFVLFSTPATQALMILAVQALAGILLPSATVFLLLLCNDTAVLGPWANKPWLNAVAAVIIGVLVELSLILATTTFFPEINVNALTVALSGLLVTALLAMGVAALLQRRRHGPDATRQAAARLDRDTWRTPPLAELAPPVWSAARRIGLLVLRGYLLISAALLVVKVVELALGH
ncbi:MAG TPA: NRAMP family divalent metal transporter [Ktedonobacterales bacterium]